ncbi:MAG: hypothetical protein K1000chlam3_01750, partial [Chlamydiae bacterium]|nr:hypothetical protein [Chlamydiota bacterium]
FSPTKINLRKDDGDFITTGEADHSIETKEFAVDRQKSSGSCFPKASNIFSLGQDVLYIAALPFHKAATTAGNAGLAIWDGGVACKTAFIDKTETFSEAVKPAFERLKTLGKDVAVLSVPIALMYWQPSLLGYNIGNSLYYIANAAALTYAVYNPKGMKVHVVNLVEDRLNVKPLKEWDMIELSKKQYAFSILDGTYSLSRLFGMHLIAKTTDETQSGKKRTDYVEKTKKDE